MTGGELSAEERAELRGDSESTIRVLATVGMDAPHHERVLALLDALDAAEARVAAVEADLVEVRAKCAGLSDLAGDHKARADAAEAKFQRCLDSENRAQAALATAEAEVARLTAERNLHKASLGDAMREARKAHTRAEALDRANAVLIEARDHAQAENARLSALVEAGMALADEWERDGGPGSAAENALGRQVVSVEFVVAKIRAALGGDGMSAVHFLPYGAYVASCGRIEDQRRPEAWSDRRKDVTCRDCQAQMTDLGDLPPAIDGGAS